MLVFWRPTTVVNLSETVWSVLHPFYEYCFDFAEIFACAHRFLEFLNVVYAVLRNLLHRFFSWFELIWISCRFYVEVQGFEVIILTKRCQWYASSDFALSLQPLYTVALTCYKDRGVLYQTSDSCKFRHDLRLLLKGPSVLNMLHWNQNNQAFKWRWLS